MAVLPTEREENVVASLFHYLTDNVTTVPIDFAGAGVEEEDLDLWIRADVMVTTPRYSRQVDQQGNMGAEPLVMLNMNIMHKQSAHEEKVFEPVKLSDTLKNLFRVPLGIAVMDHAEQNGTGINQIGILQTTEIDVTPLPFDEAKGLYVRNITSTMRYVYKWEKP